MVFLWHLNFALIVYCVNQILVGAETKRFSVTDVVATTKFQIQNHTDDVKRILNDIDDFFVHPNVSTLSVFGRQAFAIAAGKTRSKEDFYPIIACGAIGEGKIVGIADSIFLDVNWPYSNKENSSQRKLLLNTVQWACSEVYSMRTLQIGFYDSCCKSLNIYIKHKKLNTSNIIRNNMSNYSALAKYDVVVTNTDLLLHDIPILLEYVKHGGNLIMGQSSKGKPSQGHFGLSYPANMISFHAGFVWKNSSEDLEFFKGNGILTSTNRLQYTHFLDAWNIIQNVPKELNATAKQAWATVESALVSIPPNDPFWETNLPLPETLYNVLKIAIFSS